MAQTRPDGRKPDQLRPVKIQTGVNLYAEGSAIIEMGDTRVLCTASWDDKPPPHKKGTGEGWVTAEYSMLPRATQTRTPREARTGRVDGRSQEIQRLIGRALRAAVDMRLMGERTIMVDCDVLQADGGTRTASITGGFVALHLAMQKAMERNTLRVLPIKHFVSAVSVGIVQGQSLVELERLPQLVAGATQRAADRAAALFGLIAPKVLFLRPVEAELAKLFCNAWRYIMLSTPQYFFL